MCAGAQRASAIRLRVHIAPIGSGGARQRKISVDGRLMPVITSLSAGMNLLQEDKDGRSTQR
jgi:hypothetical protein